VFSQSTSLVTAQVLSRNMYSVTTRVQSQCEFSHNANSDTTRV